MVKFISGRARRGSPKGSAGRRAGGPAAAPDVGGLVCARAQSEFELNV